MAEVKIKRPGRVTVNRPSTRRPRRKASSGGGNDSSVEEGTAIGSGVSGGVLISDPSSKTGATEVFFTPEKSVVSGGGVRGPQTVAPTQTEQQLQQSLVEDLRDRPTQEVKQELRQGTPTRSITFRDETIPTSEPTPRQLSAEEEVRQISLDRPQTRIGRTPTRASFERDVFFQSLLGQQREFESLTPQEVRGRALNGDERFIGMSTPEGEVITFTPSRQIAEQEAGQAFSDLPTGTKTRLIASDVGLGIAKAAVLAVSIAPSLQFEFLSGGQIQPGEKIDPFGGPGLLEFTRQRSKSFREIEQRQLGVPGTIAQVGFGGAAVVRGGFAGRQAFKTLRAQGFSRSEAIGEIAGSFSPVRTTSGTFTRSISPEDPAVFRSVVQRQPNNVKVRSIVGKGEDFQFTSVQAFQADSGGGIRTSDIVTRVAQPGFVVRGGQIRSATVVGSQRTIAPEISAPGEAFSVKRITTGRSFQDISSPNPLEGQASISKVGVFTKPEFSVAFTQGQAPREIIATGFRGGGVSKSFQRLGVLSEQQGDVTAINIGRARPIARRSGVTFRTQTTLRGQEAELPFTDQSSFRAPKTSESPIGRGGLSGGGQQGIGQQINFQTPSIAPQSAAIKTATTTRAATSLQSPQLATSPRFVQTSQQQTQQTQQSPAVLTSSRDFSVLSVQSQRQRQLFTTKQLLDFKPLSDVRVRQSQQQDFVRTSGITIRQVPELQSVSITQFSQPSRPFITPSRTPIRFFSPTGTFLPGIPSLGLDSRSERVTKTRGFQRTPSLGAVLRFDLTGFGGGQQGSGLERTGLIERGFDFDLPKIKLGALV